MKCNCGYEYESTIETSYEDDLKNSFVETTLTITINEKQGEWDCDRLSIKPVLFCPKCGTLKIEI